MKSLKPLFGALLVIALAGFSACSESGPCYECTITVLGIQSDAEFCGETGVKPIDVTQTALGLSNTESVDSTATEYRAFLEAQGWTCTLK